MLSSAAPSVWRHGDGSRGVPFDLILLDPPYDAPDLAATLEAVSGVLAPGGLVVLEHAKQAAAPSISACSRACAISSSGDSALAFYEAEANDGGSAP